MPPGAAIDRLQALSPVRAIALLFLPIAAIRVTMVLLCAPAIPYFDEWDGVVVGMAKPLLHGGFDPKFLLASHNGHPLFWTKLVSLAFLQAQGLQFDNVPVCVCYQLLYALGAALLMATAARKLDADAGWFLLVAALMLILPFDWENITMGWGSPYMIASAFSVGLIAACAYAGRRLRGAMLVAVLGGAASLSLGSGLVAPLIGAALLLWRNLQQEIAASRAYCLCAALLAWSLLGFAIGRTTSVEDGGAALGPTQCVELALLAICWLPTWRHAANFARGERSRLDLALIATGLWAFVQIAAMIVLRPSHFRLWFPISRYMDIIAVGVLTELASLCLIARSRRGLPFGLDRAIARRALVAAAGATILASPLAFYWQVRAAADHRDQARLVRDYLASRDARLLLEAPASSLAYPSPQRLRELLDDPDVDWIISGAVERTR